MAEDGNQHTYTVGVKWTGNTGTGTDSYTGYERSHDLTAEGTQSIPASADPAFRGDPAKWNPELLLLASVAQCHMLFFLSLSARAGIAVVAYRDDPEGTMELEASGGGRFTGIRLRPHIIVSEESDISGVDELHHRAHELCFIANSLACPITVEGSVEAE